MDLIRMSVRAEDASIPMVEEAVGYYGGLYGLGADETERFLVTVEEAISQVISYGFPGRPDSMFDVSLGIEGLDLIVTISDKGIPYDYESLEGSEESRLSVLLLKGFADGASLTSMGSEGRRQVLRKHLSALPGYARSEPLLQAAPEACPYSPGDFDIHPLRRSEAIEVAQCMYDEFGYTYPHEIVYHPDGFFNAVERGECVSYVATAPDGEVAGHVALVASPSLHGTMELCMGVVRRKYRKCSIMSGLTAAAMERASHMGLRSVNAMPVAYHPFTQKVCNKQGMHPFGFSFNRLNGDLSTSYEQGSRGSLALSAILLSDPHRDIYIRPAVLDIVGYVVDDGDLDRDIYVAGCPVPLEGDSAVTAETDARMGFGRIVVRRTGEDVRPSLRAMDRRLCEQRCEVIEMLIAANEESSVAAYDEAVSLGYFCTGIFCGCDDTDWLLMEKLVFSSVDFGCLETVEPYTGLLELVEEGIPDE